MFVSTIYLVVGALKGIEKVFRNCGLQELFDHSRYHLLIFLIVLETLRYVEIF